MFNKIRDFIAAYKQINKDRINAKQCIKIINIKHREFKEVLKMCKNIEKELGEVYKYCPNDQRKDFIQCTLDFFHYGMNIVMKPDGCRTYFGGYNYGWTKRIEYLVQYLGDCYVDCYDYYNQRRYDDIVEKYEEMNKHIDEELFSVKYSYENILKEYNKMIDNNK